MVVTQNGVPDAENLGISDFELMKAVRGSYIANRYKFQDGIIRNAETAEFARRRNNSAVDLEFREDFLVYLRDVGRVPVKRNRIEKYAG